MVLRNDAAIRARRVGWKRLQPAGRRGSASTRPISTPCRRMGSHQPQPSGDPFFAHPSRSRRSSTDCARRMPPCIAAVLHDTIEDTEATLEKITPAVQPGNRRPSSTAHQDQAARPRSKSAQAQGEETSASCCSPIAEDVRVLLRNSPDRLDNMRTLGLHARSESAAALPTGKTGNLQRPLAGRMGMQELARRTGKNWLSSTCAPKPGRPLTSASKTSRRKTTVLVEEIETHSR